MKRILFVFAMFLIGQGAFAQYWQNAKPASYPHNKDLSLLANTYSTTNDFKYYGCFGYSNLTKKAKLNGRIFASETACISLDYGNGIISVDKVYFHFTDKGKAEHIEGKPYYFSQPGILKDAIIGLLISKQGWI